MVFVLSAASLRIVPNRIAMQRAAKSASKATILTKEFAKAVDKLSQDVQGVAQLTSALSASVTTFMLTKASALVVRRARISSQMS